MARVTLRGDFSQVPDLPFGHDRPEGVAVQLRVDGGAGGIAFDRQRLGGVGGGTVLESTGADRAADRYVIELNGGAGNDTFVFNTANFGKDTITGFLAGATTEDKIEFDASVFADFGAVLAATMQVGSNAVITYDANNTITLVNVQMAALHTDDFIFFLS